ncbi:MAG: C45 family autoproteolytic acyltransferase/hydrolase [Chloroflexota bacterium]
MSRLIRIVFILIAGAAAGRPITPRIIGPAAASGGTISPAIVTDHGHLQILHLRGTPYEMGYQHGAAQRENIQRWLREAIYDRTILQSGESHGILLAQAQQIEALLPPELQQELRGIADGAGLLYQELLLLNLALNRLTPYPLLPTASPPTLELQALAFVARQPATSASGSSEGALLGYLLDAPGQATRLRRHLLVLIYEPEEGQPHATLTWSGQVGAWCGVNQSGVAVCATPSTDGRLEDLETPPALLTRQLLVQARNGEQALRQAIARPYQATFHLLIADGNNQTATAITFGDQRYDIRPQPETPQDNIVSVPAGSALEPLLKRNADWLNQEKALAALASRQPGICGQDTLLNVLFLPGRGEFWLGLDLWPASCRRYLRLRLSD